MPPLLALLMPLLAAANASTVWHSAVVKQDQLISASRSQTIQVSEEIMCAIQASHTPWCHLFVHNANDCVLYDLLVDSLADPPPEGQASAVADCRTRHRNVCIVAGEALPHGTEKEVDCFPYICWNRVFAPAYRAFSTCDAPFSSVDLGCVYLSLETKTWCEARQACFALNADLAVSAEGHFSLLQTFLISSALRKDVWVGVKARRWLDGRSVTTDEWFSEDPDGAPDYCARMAPISYPPTVADKECETSGGAQEGPSSSSNAMKS